MGSLRSTTAVLNSVAGAGVQELQGGNFLLLLTASSPVQIRVERGNGGHAEVFDNISGGFLIRRLLPWANLRILGTAGAAVTFMYGTAETDKDETDIRLQIATIAGVTAVITQPRSGFVNRAPVVTGVGQAALFAANLSRLRISAIALSTNTESVFVRTAGGANNIGEIQPGMSFSWDNTSALDYQSTSGGQTVMLLEET